MATTSKRPKKQGLAAIGGRFLLQDFRLVSVKAERMSPPEKDRKGAYAMKGRLEANIPDGEFDKFTLNVFLEVTGFNVSGTSLEPQQKDREKTVSISVQCEALFNYISPSDAKATAAIVNNDLITSLNKQVHPLLIERVRFLAADMGYGVIMPALGIDDVQLGKPVNRSPAATSQPRPAKVKVD